MEPEKNLHASFPPDLLAKAQAAARREHVSVDEWLKETMERRLKHPELDTVTELARQQNREPEEVLREAIQHYAATHRLERFAEKMAKRAREKGIREEDAPDLVRRARRFTDKEIESNLRDVADAVAQQELEGLKVSPETVEDMQRAARGELEPEDVIRNIHARLKHAQILQR